MQSPLFVLALPLFVFSLQQPLTLSAQSSPAAKETPSTEQSIPAEAKQMANPVTPTPESLARAKTIYGYDCAMCHGIKGDGKGDLVEPMKLTMKDYTNPAALKDMTDGELFYIIENGRGKMPGEKGRAKPDEMWNMVILIRSFSKPQ